MKTNTKYAMALLLAGTALLPGCRGGPNAATGALVGGLLGAGGGYAIGHHRGNRTNYALAGAAAGALGGYVIGDQIDEADRDRSYGPDARERVYESAPRSYERVYEREPRVVERVYVTEPRVVRRTRVIYRDPCPCDGGW